MLTVINNDVKISCRGAGLPDGAEAALFIHGMNTNMAFWHPLLVRRLGEQRRIAMFDLRGHGRSGIPEQGYTSAHLASDALAVLDELGLSQVDVVAHSFGATVALQVARQHPERVRSLVLLDGRARILQPEIRLGQWSQFERWQQKFAAAGVELDPNLEIDFRLPFTIDSEAWAAARDELVADGFFAPASSKRAVEKFRRLIQETAAPKELTEEAGLTLESLPTIHQPTLAIYGSYSPYLPTQEKFAELLPNCETAGIENLGHNFPLMAPEATSDAIEQFWQRCREAATA